MSELSELEELYEALEKRNEELKTGIKANTKSLSDRNFYNIWGANIVEIIHGKDHREYVERTCGLDNLLTNKP